METVEQLLSNCSALSKLGALGRSLTEGLNFVSRADIKTLHRFSSSLSWLRSARAHRSEVALSITYINVSKTMNIFGTVSFTIHTYITGH